MDFVEVGSVTDLDDGQMVGFEVDDRRILLAKVDGEFFAIGATCTHERANLDQGALLGHVVYCPLHYSAFDVRSGAVLGPPAECATPAHEVKVEDGKVLVSTQPLGTSVAPASNGAAVSHAPPEHAAAEPQAPPDAPVAPEPQEAEPQVAAAEPQAAASAEPPTPASAEPPAPAEPPAAAAAAAAESQEAVAELRAAVAELKETVAELQKAVRELQAPKLQAAPAPTAAAKATTPSPGGEYWSMQKPLFMGRLTTSARYLVAAIAIPGGLVALLVFTAAVLFEEGPAVPEGDILFEHFIGHGWLDVFVLSLVGVVGLLAATGLRRFWKGLGSTLPPAIPRQPLGDALRGTARDVVTHDGFDQWTTSHVRRGSHLAIFYGFLGLMAATTGAALYTEIFPILGIDWQGNKLSLPIWDPVKIVGNVGGIALLLGLAQTLRRRPRPAGKSGYADLFFPVLLGLTALSGFLTEILRFAGVRTAYPSYAIHLVFVFALFVYFPFSKFAHVMYQPAALTFGRQIRKKKPAPTLTATAAPPLDSDTAAV